MSAGSLLAAWAAEPSRNIGLCSSDASEDEAIDVKDLGTAGNTDPLLYHAYWFRRWGFGLGAIHRLIVLIKRSRAIYLNGIATWPTTLGAIICCLFRRPFVIAPRGGLMPEHVRHIRQNRPAKWMFYKLFTFPWLKKASALHCTGNVEANGVRTIVGEHPPLIIVPNGIPLQPIISYASPKAKDNITLSYVGRISHEKGINAFLRIWLKAKRPGDRFFVAGGGSGVSEADYFKEFQHLVTQSGGAIEYQGYLSAQNVNDMITNSHFLVLPSGLDGDVRENFGIAAAEALALGRPVIVSKGLEWNDIESNQAGLVFNRNVQAVFDVIRRAANIQKITWVHMTEKARNYAEQRLDIRVTAEKVWEAVTASAVSSSSEKLVCEQRIQE